MFAIVFGFQVFIPCGADGDDDSDFATDLAHKEGPFSRLDASNGFRDSQFPRLPTRIDATDGFDAVMGAVTVGFIDAFDFDFYRHVCLMMLSGTLEGPRILIDPSSPEAKVKFLG